LSLAIAATAIAADPARSWDDLIAELRTLDRVSGSAVNYEGGPGEFFTLSQSIIPMGKEDDFLKLLTDAQPAARCMGLLAIAKTSNEKGVAILRSRLFDRGVIEYQPVGCMFGHTTVGGFARELLFNINILDYPKRPKPLLSRRELTGVDVEVLASDSAMAVHDDAERDLAKLVEGRLLGFRLPSLRRYAPSLKDSQIIKGIGRLKPSVAQRDFLLACLRAGDLDIDGRLAAASALTHHVDDQSFQALQEQLKTLNQIGGQPWGGQFIETLNVRRACEKSIQPVPARESAYRSEVFRRVVTIGSTSRHPLVLDYLLDWSRMPDLSRDADHRSAWASALIGISRNLRDFNQPWNTYADAAFKLDNFVQLDRKPERWRTLTESECVEIERIINEFLVDRAPETKP
jgi:hypothetical protein